MAVRLLLERYDSGGRDVQVYFGIGGNSVRGRTTLDDASALPDVPETGKFHVGVAFSFCAPFGSPEVQLDGLVVLRRQAVSARCGIWHLKPEYSARMSERWK